MIINNAPENAVELSGATATSEFRIRNSAKAFGILSSGLYANKIRAIIREIGCNAIDSHVAAGKPDLPFEVHLPTALSPYFWIRDFGVGLNHDEVINIYTTYFESTKTNSNAFIGALGLGSKSPFSYTDNFTVTAIKDGVKRVYSAFINEHGVPSVALMGEAQSEEQNGVEVKFSVNDRDDYYRFKIEAEATFMYFKIKPKVLGAQITIPAVAYSSMNIIPGVHQRKDEDHYHGAENRAIMGNIAYPIDIPKKKKKGQYDHLNYYEDRNSQDPMDRMAKVGIDIHFDIGEIEFQASREGLSYTQATIDAIHRKYQAILDAIEGHLEKELSAKTNLWDRANLLMERAKTPMWATAAAQYHKKFPNPLIENSRIYHGGMALRGITVKPADIATKYNINLLNYSVQYYKRGRNGLRPLTLQKADHKGELHMSMYHSRLHFVRHEDLKLKGYVGNLRYHFGKREENQDILVMQPLDEKLPVKYDEFMKEVFFDHPSVILDKDLDVAPKIQRVKSDRKVNILEIGRHRNKGELAWSECIAQPKEMDVTKTYYYVPMHGYTVTLEDGVTKIDIKETFESFRRCYPHTALTSIYGVRKGDLDVVEALPNWKPALAFLRESFANLSEEDFYRVAINEIDRRSGSIYTNERIAAHVTNAASPFKAFQKQLSKIDSSSMHELKSLCELFAPKVSIKDLEEKAKKKAKDMSARYPMLQLLDHVGWDAYEAVAAYVNLIDSTLKE